MNANELRVLFELAKNKGCKFTTLTYRSTESGELARHTLLFGVDYKSAIEHDLAYLNKLKKYVDRKSIKTSDDQLFVQAVNELVNAMEKSKTKQDTAPAADNVYDFIFPGIKQHKDTGVYYIWGFAHRKVVLEPGKDLKPSKSKDVTLVKDKIRNKLRTTKYRQFKLSNIGKATVNGNTITVE